MKAQILDGLVSLWARIWIQNVIHLGAATSMPLHPQAEACGNETMTDS